MINNMKIDIASIESKLNDPLIIEFKYHLKNAIEKFIGAIKEFEKSGKERRIDYGDNDAVNHIKNHANQVGERIEDDDVKHILDTLRHTFSCYARNGLHQLYTRQENEIWHPKIILTEILTPNDIDSLKQGMSLYRGCDIGEHEKKAYGQAWTTSLEVAKNFAYEHYQHGEWFNAENRIVLETTYSKDNVLFSNQEDVELEVVLDTHKLKNVNICYSSP